MWYRTVMSLLRVFGFAIAVFLLSVSLQISLAYADAADDLLRALGMPLPAEATASDVSVPPPLETTIAASSTEEIAAFEAQRQAQISELQALVVVLAQQLKDLIAKQTADEQAAAQAVADAAAKAKAEAEKPDNCTAIKRNLARGDKGEDVRCLQHVLAANTLLERENVTGVYGPLTEKAVKLFQLEMGIVTAPGSVGPKTLAEINEFMPYLRQGTTNATTTPSNLDSVFISFGPQLPNGIEIQDFVLLAKEKHDYALRITTQDGGIFHYTIDWADGATDSGLTRSGVFKTISHAYAAGVYEAKVMVWNSEGFNESTFTLGINAAGGEGDFLEITSPIAAFTFDVITLMPVTVKSKDARANNNVRLYLQNSANARPGSGQFIGELGLDTGEGTGKFPLTDVAAGAYWLQAIGTRFQECQAAVCQEFLPNHTVGPIQITDKTNFYMTKMASSTSADIHATTTSDVL